MQPAILSGVPVPQPEAAVLTWALLAVAMARCLCLALALAGLSLQLFLEAGAGIELQSTAHSAEFGLIALLNLSQVAPVLRDPFLRYRQPGKFEVSTVCSLRLAS